jgi:hypothetical protein
LWYRINTLPGEIHWSWYRMTLPGEKHWLWYRMPHCQVKYTGCGTVWHIARLHWSWYCMTHCQVKGTGRGTVWHIARWNTLVVVPHSTLSGVIHWLWYRMTYIARLHWSWYRIIHCQVKYTGRGIIWHNARWNTLVVVPYDTLPGARHWSLYRMTHINTWPSWKRIKHFHKFRNYKSIRQHLSFCVDRKCKITYFYVTNNPFRINVSIVVLSVIFYNDFVQFCVDR